MAFRLGVPFAAFILVHIAAAAGAEPAVRNVKPPANDDCLACREDPIAQPFAASIHSPLACVDCHTAHQIARADTDRWRLSVLGECGSCHVESMRTYRDTFHDQVSPLDSPASHSSSLRC